MLYVAAAVLLVLQWLWHIESRRRWGPIQGSVRFWAGFLVFAGAWAIGYGLIGSMKWVAACGVIFAVAGGGLWSLRAWSLWVALSGIGAAFVLIVAVSALDGWSVLNLVVLASLLYAAWELWRLKTVIAVARVIARGAAQANNP